MNPAYNPFDASDCCVIDELHVRVDRFVTKGSTGPSVRFRKVFKSSPGYDYTWFNTHECDLLLEFKQQRILRVAQVAVANWSNENTFEQVQTLDAGPSLFHWLQLEATALDGSAAPHPLSEPQALLRLLRSALLALSEIHAKGYVHCDIDDRNICLPFALHPTLKGAFTPLWNQLKLIDFAFSLGKNHPLRVPLPIKPDALMHSPAFMQALEADHQAGSTRRVQRLDGRIDLHALGAMAERMLTTLLPLWVGSVESKRMEALVRAFIRDLKNQDTTPGMAMDPQVHQRLLLPLDRELTSAGSDFRPPFTLPRAVTGQGAVSAARGRPLQPGSAGEASARPRPAAAWPRTAAATPLAAIPIATPLAAAPTPLRLPAQVPAQVQVLQVTTQPTPVYLPPVPAPAPVLRRASAVRPASQARVTLLQPPMPGTWAGIWQRLSDSVLLERYRRRAGKGDAEACFQVGCVVMRGQTTKLDPTAALQWFLTAAQQGHAAAQAAAAACFDTGYGTAPDDAQAAAWYIASAQGGYAAGHYGIGNLLVYGRGVAEDAAAAIEHFRAAAEAGMPEAYNALGQMILAGRGAMHHRGDAMECFKRAAGLGHAASAHQLGRLHEQPEPGALPDPQLAKDWYQRAVKLGEPKARADFARLHKAFPS